MKCLVGMLVATGFCLMPLLAEAGGKPDPMPKDAKVLIAHLQEVIVTETEEIDEELGPVIVKTTTNYYVVIEIAPQAVAAHEAHGDIATELEKGAKFTTEDVKLIPIDG